MPEWQLPALPFTLSLWSAVLVSYILSILCIMVCDYYVDLSTISEIAVGYNLELRVRIIFALISGNTHKYEQYHFGCIGDIFGAGSGKRVSIRCERFWAIR